MSFQNFENNTRGFNFIDLFAGIGGIRLGFDKEFKKNIKTVFVSEWDKYAQETYKTNFKDEVKIYGDITKVDIREIPEFDICLAGFPCQAFSLAGKRMVCEDTSLPTRRTRPSSSPSRGPAHCSSAAEGGQVVTTKSM